MNHKYIINSLALAASFLLLFSGCKDSFLEPKPLSFFTPENAYKTADDFYAALTACEMNMRDEYSGDEAPAFDTELITSDIAVEGTTDKSGPAMNLDVSFLPGAKLNDVTTCRVGYYWSAAYTGIKYANIIISYLPKSEITDSTVYNALLGSAYFQRAFHYYKLVHQFGNVPYLDGIVEEPKVDFNTYDRWSILEKMKENMEFAYKWVPEKVDRGRTSNAACGVLLMKICMCLGDFDRAIQIGKEIVTKYPLMRERFTANKTKPHTNLMHDLHSVEAKLDMSNTEGLMYVVSYPEVEGSTRITVMRQTVPYWIGSCIVTPDGEKGTNIYPDPSETADSLDNNALYGKGLGRVRLNNYFQYTIWTEKEKNDLRSPNNHDSWKRMEDLCYNDPGLKGKSEWYGKHLVRPANMTANDSVRSWFMWPQYKTFIPDPLNTEKRGGESPWYIYRSAEVYLLLAECYYWKNDPASAAKEMNEVRTRAGADPLVAADINIGEILNERARELYFEENRHIELVRIAYTFAKTGKPCEVFDGHVYRLDNFSGNGVVGMPCKDKNVNFWYDWVMKNNNFYRDHVVTAHSRYDMSVHHVLWPVPENEIDDNTQGTINQNIGYPGADNNITPLQVPEEGTVIPPVE